MPTQKQGTTRITRVCFHTSKKALATLFGACPNFLSKWSTGNLLYQKHAVRFKMSSSLQCPLCQQADSALHILSGCWHTIISGMITERHNTACRLIMKAKALWQVVWPIWMPAALIGNVRPNKTFKFMSMLITGLYPAGFLVLVYLLEIDSPLVALIPFWSPPYLLKNPYRQPLLICTRCHTQDIPAEMYADSKSTSSISAWGRYPSLRLDTVKIREATKKQHEVLCKRLKAKKFILHTILLGVGGSIHTSPTLNQLKEFSLDAHKAHKTALKLHAHSVLYAHKLTTTRRALEKSSCSQGLGLEQGAACHPPGPH